MQQLIDNEFTHNMMTQKGKIYYEQGYLARYVYRKRYTGTFIHKSKHLYLCYVYLPERRRHSLWESC